MAVHRCSDRLAGLRDHHAAGGRKHGLIRFDREQPAASYWWTDRGTLLPYLNRFGESGQKAAPR